MKRQLKSYWKDIVFRRKDDPSLRDQLRERADLREDEQMKAYLEACQKAPLASASTRKKWRKAIGL